MTNKNRWNKAQNYEKNWWQQRHNSIDLSYLKRFADDLMNATSQFHTYNDNSKILEIGSGPAGIITHLPGKLRCAIDPLDDFYASVPEYSKYRDKKVQYSNAKGEELPFDDNTFNLIIIDNVLDHCQEPEQVLREVNRVLENDGIIYFKQNVYHSIGKVIRNLLEKIEFDKGHPHNYTKKDIHQLFDSYNYKLLSLTERGHFKQLLVELKMRNLKAFLRVLTFMTRDKITMILKK